MTRVIGPIPLGDEEATSTLARRLAARAESGDTFLLHGPIGAGKSHFARAFIRARLRNPDEDVPSPTFTLVQTYQDTGAEIWHCDLYRLTHPDEVIELGLDEAFADAICLIEWPDRLGSSRPDKAIDITLSAEARGHRATIRLPSDKADRLGPALD